MTAEQPENPNLPPQDQRIRHAQDMPSTPPVPRDFTTAFGAEMLAGYHAGVMQYTYRGVSCLKSPIDLAIYMLLIHDLRPRTIVEIGSFHGGAALFYADLCENYGLHTDIVTVDYRRMGANDEAELDPRIAFVQADAMELNDSPLHARLEAAPRPWLVIEDSAHTRDVTFAVIEYFAEHMQTGEYLIVEDGVIEDQGANGRFGGGPNLAVHDFFVARPEVFELDTHYNDFFGRNASFNPNGYLRRR